MTSDAQTAHRVRIVSFGVAHVGRTYEWVSDPDLRRQFLLRHAPDPEEHRAHFDGVLSDPTQRVFALLVDDEHVGNGGLKHLTKGRRDAELWIYVGEIAARGQGFGRAGALQLLHVAFGDLELDSVYLHVADSNEAARGMYVALGFREEPMGPEDAGVWRGRGCRVLRMVLDGSAWT